MECVRTVSPSRSTAATALARFDSTSAPESIDNGPHAPPAARTFVGIDDTMCKVALCLKASSAACVTACSAVSEPSVPTTIEVYMAFLPCASAPQQRG